MKADRLSITTTQYGEETHKKVKVQNTNQIYENCKKGVTYQGYFQHIVCVIHVDILYKYLSSGIL